MLIFFFFYLFNFLSVLFSQDWKRKAVVKKILIIFFIFSVVSIFESCWFSISHNVAGLREGGAFLLTRCKYNKVFYKDKTWWGNLHPRSCETLVICCAICFQCLIFAIKRWEIYSFFGGGKRGEGKSSFADMGFGAGLAVCKCAFSFAVGFWVWFVNDDGRI